MMMSNSNYSIGLQRLKPVQTAYCGLHILAKNWSWARDINGRDRDICLPRRDRDVWLCFTLSHYSQFVFDLREAAAVWNQGDTDTAEGELCQKMPDTCRDNCSLDNGL